jgi:hypothetical protein
MVGAGSLAFLAPAVAHQQNGNPAGPADPVDGRHDVIVESGGVPKTVSLVRSKPDGCAFNTGQFAAPACTTPSIVDISSPAFGGTGNVQATMLLCNGKRAAGTDAGGDDDPTGGCDFANARGLAGPPVVIVAGSGTFTEDGAGNLTGGVGGVPASGRIPLTLTSCNGGGGSMVPDLLTPLGGAMCTNSNTTTTCPPTQGQISGGFTCIVTVAEFDAVALTAGDHVGFRQINMKSPIPTKLCDPPGAPVSFGACAATISAGTAVQLTGVRFPCKTIQPDDPAVNGNQGSCQVAQTGKTILIKRNSTGLLEGGAITPTSQSAGVNGDYVVTFTMPTLLHPGELYKLVPHAADCVFNQGAAGLAPPNNWRVKTCESGKFNAAGPSVKQ